MITGLAVDDLKWKRALLLHYMGEDINDIFDTLPDTGEDKDYKKALHALNTYFVPQANVEFAIYRFRQAKQQTAETFDDFHTRLQQLPATCEFTAKDKEI